jgi:hypothetical protein
MRIRNTQRRLMWGLGGAAILAAALVVGCSDESRVAEQSGAVVESTTKPADPLAGIFGPAPQKTGVQLWGENCTRCHYNRPPSTYSGAQWTLVAAHMRSRANLTGDEERKILAFLQSSAGAEQ